MNIKAGDLVMIVRECSPQAGGVGLMFRVASIGIKHKHTCLLCAGNHTGAYAFSEETFGDNFTCSPLAWLIKIDPPSPPESTTHEKEVTA